MTYRQLLEAIEEAKARQDAVNSHEASQPTAVRGPHPYRRLIEPDPSEWDKWRAKLNKLDAELDEEIPGT
jgi:hypothetical protein